MDRREATRSLFRSAGLVSVLALVKGGLAFVGTIVITRVLGPAGRGKFAFVITTAGLLSWLVSWGIGPTITRSKATGRDTVADLYAGSWGVGVITGAVMTSLWLAAFFLFRNELFSGVSAADAYWIAFLIPALIVTFNVGHVASLDGKVVSFNALLAGGSVLFVVATVALTMGDSLTTSNTIAIWSVTSALPVVVFWAMTRSWGRYHGATVKRLLAGSLRSMLASLAVFGIYRVDVFFVKAQRGYTELGFYGVATSIAEVLLLVAVSIRSTLLLHQGESENREALPPLLAHATRLTCLAMVATGVCVVVAGSPVIRLLYGADVAPAYPGLVLLMPGVIALALVGPLFDFLYSEHKANGVITVMILALLLNMVMNMVLLRTHTFLAASVSSTVAYLLALVACVVQFTRVTGCSIRSVLVVGPDDLRGLRSRVSRAEPDAT